MEIKASPASTEPDLDERGVRPGVQYNPGGKSTKPADREPVFYTVEDENATSFNKVKQHSIPVPQPNGKVQNKTFTFRPGEPLKMLQEHALLFLDISPAFKVRNSLGQLVRPRKFSKGETRTVTLKPHEVVVPVTHVLKGVLHEMARMIPGGAERFTKDEGFYKRHELEEFIISGGKVEDDDGPLDTVVAA